ncbi:MAG: sirohydrochlorin chelatase [Maricaulaceae bacterium]
MTVQSATRVVMVGHGERGGARDDDSLKRAARRGADALAPVHVRAAILSEPETVADALAGDWARLVVYPWFLSDGFFVTDKLPKAIADAWPRGRPGRPDITPPLGFDPALPDVISDAAAQVVSSDTGALNMVLIAHGSARSNRSELSARGLVQAIAKRNRFRTVSVGFLEQEPFAEAVVRQTPGPMVLVGLFLGAGLHGGEDFARLVAQAGSALVGRFGLAELDAITDMAIARIRCAVEKGGGDD